MWNIAKHKQTRVNFSALEIPWILNITIYHETVSFDIYIAMLIIVSGCTACDGSKYPFQSTLPFIYSKVKLGVSRWCNTREDVPCQNSNIPIPMGISMVKVRVRVTVGIAVMGVVPAGAGPIWFEECRS